MDFLEQCGTFHPPAASPCCRGAGLRNATGSDFYETHICTEFRIELIRHPFLSETYFWPLQMGFLLPWSSVPLLLFGSREYGGKSIACDTSFHKQPKFSVLAVCRLLIFVQNLSTVAYRAIAYKNRIGADQQCADYFSPDNFSSHPDDSIKRQFLIWQFLTCIIGFVVPDNRFYDKLSSQK